LLLEQQLQLQLQLHYLEQAVDQTPEFFETIQDLLLDHKDISMGSLIGRGRYGYVFQGTYKGFPVAIKKLQISPISISSTLKVFLREVSCLKKLKHTDNIIQLLGVTIHQDLCVILRLMTGGSLNDLIHKHQIKFSYFQKIRICREIANGVKNLHSFKPPILHRDLTLSNILMESTEISMGSVCIADFGISIFKNEKGPQPFTPIGRLRYMAPEVLKKENYTKKADQFMFGHVLYEIFTSLKPFSNLNADQAAEKIKLGELPVIPGNIVDITHEIKKLMLECWAFKSKRPSFKKILCKLDKILKKGDQDYFINRGVNNHYLQFGIDNLSQISTFQK